MGAFFSAIIGKSGLILAMVMISLIALAVVARNWSCRQQRHRDPRVVMSGPFKVVSVETGASLTVESGRRGRTDKITLLYVAAPIEGPMAKIATDHLRQMAGTEITIQYERHGIFRGSEDEAQSSQRRLDDDSGMTAEAPALGNDGVEARLPSTGMVFGQSGIPLNLAMVEGAYADCTADAPKEFQVAKAKAQKKKAGIWWVKK